MEPKLLCEPKKFPGPGPPELQFVDAKEYPVSAQFRGSELVVLDLGEIAALLKEVNSNFCCSSTGI